MSARNDDPGGMMLAAWGRIVYVRRRLVVIVAAVLVVAAGGFGFGLFGSLAGAGFEDPDSDSERAAVRSAELFSRSGADAIALYSSDLLTVDDPAFEAAVTDVVDSLPPDSVVRAVSFYDTLDPALVSDDRHATYVAITLAGTDDGDREDNLEELHDDLVAEGLTTQIGGDDAVSLDIGERVGEDIGRAESLALPLVLLLSILIFGSVVAASMPFMVGVLAIVGSFAALRLLTYATDVSVFAINIITLLGLGLAVDYALFIVSRFREELRAGKDVPEAIQTTVQTAGRTVLFSGLTVGISLASLLLFPQTFFRSMGFGGMAAVVIGMVAAVGLLPAVLGMLGEHVNAWRVPGIRGPGAEKQHGFWSRIAHAVMRRPVLVATGVVVVLAVLASLFLRAGFGGVDYRMLPEDVPSRQVAESLETDFPDRDRQEATVVVTGADPSAVEAYAASASQVEGVEDVAITAQEGDAAQLQVTYHGDPFSDASQQLVDDLRNLPAPPGAEALVGGDSAEFVDLLASLAGTLPWMALLVALTTFVLLFLAFGSVVLPVKAIVMNTISIAASFGVVVWVFQDGHLTGVLDFTSTGQVEAAQPILMLAILFGLSMDYEVFMLSRVREEWDRIGDNTAAVAAGLQRTGRIITSAALLLAIVIGAFSTSGIVFIKMVGVGMLVALLLDATVVRGLLVPATMRLLGRWNWWAPGPMRRFWERYGILEGGEHTLVVADQRPSGHRGG
jgi:trehalose monomycolate/heme transporter